MLRTIMYGVLCLMLMTFAPLINSHAADLQPSAGSEFKSVEIKSADAPARVNQAPQIIATIDSVGHKKPPDKVIQVPLPSDIWLLGSGLLALVLIRRRHK
jgi:hypothetical protein